MQNQIYCTSCFNTGCPRIKFWISFGFYIQPYSCLRGNPCRGDLHHCQVGQVVRDTDCDWMRAVTRALREESYDMVSRVWLVMTFSIKCLLMQNTSRRIFIRTISFCLKRVHTCTGRISWLFYWEATIILVHGPNCWLILAVHLFSLV